ncbi:amino acid adenylation domain-containing protein [Pseudomonas sp. CGJS7]|uniref:amino acid adenylation domain-containing protein n=1 Tax=Pseudomonas sp. CGJS7 TaxID=3109348 RepID=UPI0030086759
MDEQASPQLRDQLAQLLDLPVSDIAQDRNLIELGMDSITMMRLAGQWRRQGIAVSFAELAEQPSLAAWQSLIARKPALAPAPPAPAVAADARDFDEHAPFDLALMQHAYWIGRAQGQQLGGVAAHFYNEFDGTGLEPERLQRAVERLIQRHPMLRVRVLEDGRQCVLPRSGWPGLRVHDLRAMSKDAAEQALQDTRASLSHRHLDIGAGEVFDIQLSLLPDTVRIGGTRLHVNLDMIAADALSLRVLLGDLAVFYADADPAPAPIGYSYARYLRDRETALNAPERAAALAADRRYWLERLAELPGAPQLPVAAHDAVLGATRVLRRHRWLEPARMRAFEAHARRHGLTPAMALAAVFAEALTAWSAEPRFSLNLPVFDREPLHAEVGALVGDFTSSLLLAWDGARPGGFAERAAALQERFHADVRHIGCSGVEVLRELSRSRGEQVLAPVVYTSALGLGELFPERVKREFGQASWIISQGPQVWLDAQVTELDDGLLVNIDAREDAFAPGVLDAMFEAYSGLLDRLIDDESAWRAAPGSLLPSAQVAQREAANASAAPRSRQRLHDGLFECAQREPQRPALLWGERETMSYGELAERALGLAGWLHRRGVGRGDTVAIHLPKGPEQAVAALGVLAAGAVYLPIGIDQPALRRQRICDAAQVAYLLDALPAFDPADALAEPVPGADTDLAYVLYTSGSTGEPKGVEIEHGAAMNTIDDLNRRLALGPDDRTLALSALEFDLSVYDLFAPLSVGGAVICIGEHERRDAAAWVALGERHRATVLNCVPALLDMTLSAAGDDAPAPRLRAVLLGGDWVTLDLPGRLKRWAPSCRFIALGGTTETAIHSTFCEVEQVAAHWKSVPYAKPLGNVRLRVVDAIGRDCPDYVEGELWIGGDGVARGYRGDPQRSAQKFLELDGVRWYRTGDRARYWADGDVEFLGRADFQVKLRGHRIELGEIEAALGASEQVAQAVAVVGERGLTAVVVARESSAEELIDLRQPPSRWEPLREFLAERLPPAMLPERLWLRPALPLTGNGKIDRPALRKAVDALTRDAGPAFTPPRGEIEQRVADAWAALLGATEVGREHSFFALGGDSLSATRLVRTLRSQGLNGATLGELFARPVLAEFAASLRLGDAAPEASAPKLVAYPENRYEPFDPTEVQRAYWLGRDESFVLGGVGCHFYREYDATDLDLPRLQRALNRLIERHDMLRAVFDEQGRQRVLERVPEYAIDCVDGGDEPLTAEAQLREQCAHRVFDPTQWPLFCVRAVRSGRRTRLAVSLDNLILDALSILRFYTELAELYERPDQELAPPALSFRDYLQHCAPDAAELAAARGYWQQALPQLPSAPQLPLACDPAQIRPPRFVRHDGAIDATRWQTILARAAEHGVTASGVLLAAFAEVLSQWSAQPELSLNLTLFDRKDVHPEIDRVMGDFTSLTLVGYRPEPGDDWRTRVRRVQGELGRALDHRAMSSVALVRELTRSHGHGDIGMPVVFTSALGVPGGTRAAEHGPFSRQVWGLTQTPQVWLDHQVVEADGGIALNWDAVEGLFPEALIETMFAAYLRLLDWLAQTDWSAPAPALQPSQQRAVRAAATADHAAHTDASLHESFFRIAGQSPERVALRWGNDRTMSYGELAERALRAAAALRADGAGAGEIVAVNLPKGPEQIAAVLGVLAAGAAYLPLGVDQPPARRERILAQAQVRRIVSNEDGLDPSGRRILDYAGTQTWTPQAQPIIASPQDTAYLIFTSGSTGEPKGVEISHAAAWNTIADVNRRFGVDGDDRFMAVSALDFDLSVYDIFGALSLGASLVLIEEEARRDARRWHELACAHQATVWNSVPALLDMLLTVGSPQHPPGALRLALLSGDWVGLDLPGRLAAQRPNCRFVALGGATEAAIWSNFHEVAEVDPDWRSIPYGRPLSRQRFRVVDSSGRDSPDWVPGELWIGGAGVARGYYGAAEITARQFVEHAGERWYRTGDLGRYWPDGTLEFLGRRDHQVKIRGHRIELGEIESVLSAEPGVTAAVALVATVAGARRLGAAVIAADGFDSEALQARLAAALPAHMWPERVLPLAQWPLSGNGKIDRIALASELERLWHDGRDEATAQPPQDEWERAVADDWSQLLEVEVADRDAGFFALGGDSLLATRYLEQVRRRDGLELPLPRLFAAPRLHQVAASLRQAHHASQSMEEGVL